MEYETEDSRGAARLFNRSQLWRRSAGLRRWRRVSACRRGHPDQLPATKRLRRVACRPCTDGPAIGDFKGAVGVAVLAVAGNVLHNHHHWVTDTGDTIFFKDADLTLLSTSTPGLFVGDYFSGIYITGGTGTFENATGKISAFGAIDENKGQLTLRYEGTVCFAPVPAP